MGGQVFKNLEDLQPMEQTVSTSKLNELQASMLAMIVLQHAPQLPNLCSKLSTQTVEAGEVYELQKWSICQIGRCENLSPTRSHKNAGCVFEKIWMHDAMVYKFGAQRLAKTVPPLPDHSIICTLCDLTNWWFSMQGGEGQDWTFKMQLANQFWESRFPFSGCWIISTTKVCNLELVWKLEFGFQLQPCQPAPPLASRSRHVKAHEDCCSAKKWWWQCRWPASIDPWGSAEPWVPQWWAPAPGDEHSRVEAERHGNHGSHDCHSVIKPSPHGNSPKGSPWQTLQNALPLQRHLPAENRTCWVQWNLERSVTDLMQPMFGVRLIAQLEKYTSCTLMLMMDESYGLSTPFFPNISGKACSTPPILP